jgi:hypothetical protein
MDHKTGFWVLITIGGVLTLMYLAGQSLALFAFDYTVQIGLQESREEIGEVGIAFAKGFGFGDTLVLIPLFVIGVIGLFKQKLWGTLAMSGALAINIYWPLVHLYAVYVGREAMNLSEEKMITFTILLPLIAIYGVWGIWYIYKNQNS